MGSNMDDPACRFEESMERDWLQFRRGLADRLAGLSDGEVMVVEVASEAAGELMGALPYCQAAVHGEVLRVEAVSNRFLDASCRLDQDEEMALVELGLQRVEDANFRVDLPQAHVDEAAVLITYALREVYAVIHPSQLVGESDETGGPVGMAECGVTSGSAGTGEPYERDTSSHGDDVPVPDGLPSGQERPHGRDGLVKALAALVKQQFGDSVGQDEDGDMLILTPQGVGVWVYVSPAAPRILIHSILVLDVQDEARALAEVNVLNMQNVAVTFVLRPGQIAVSYERGVVSLAKEEVLGDIRRIVESVDGWTDALIARVGGRRQSDDGPARRPLGRGGRDETDASDPEPRRAQRGKARAVRGDGKAPARRRDPRLEEGLRVLKELEAEEPGSLDPATLAAIFDQDRTLLLAAMDEQMASMRRWGRRASTARAREDDAHRERFLAMCRARQRHHHELRARLRAALRITVRPAGVRPEPGQGTLFGADECTEAAG